MAYHSLDVTCTLRVCICMYQYFSRVYSYVTYMYSCVTLCICISLVYSYMYSYVTVCYLYVSRACYSKYSCGVLVKILKFPKSLVHLASLSVVPFSWNSVKCYSICQCQFREMHSDTGIFAG